MGLYSNFPYTDYENLNLDWIINKVKEYIVKVDKLDTDFIDLNTYVTENIDDIREYVNNYFDNLDVQEEVDNKLQEMYDSGELLQLIEQFLNVNTILTFNTTASLKNGTQFVNDSTAMRLGDLTYNDGKTDLYKIRTLTSSDVIDEVNILSLTNFPTLIAELIPNYNTNENYILIGDSYTGNVVRDGELVTGWWERLINALGLTEGVNVWKSGEGQAGYYKEGIDGHNFYTLLVNLADTLTLSQKNSINKILLAGGVNDARYSPDDDYTETFNSLSNFVLTNFPNATIYIVPIGMTHETRGRRRLIPLVCQKIKDCCLPHRNIKYIHGAWLPLYNTSMMSSDGLHPNNEGEKIITSNLIQALNNIEAHYYTRENITVTLDPTLFKSDEGQNVFDIDVQLQDMLLSINFGWINQLFELISTWENYTMNGSYKTIGTYASNLIPVNNGEIRIHCTGRVRQTNGIYEEYEGVFSFTSGQIKLVTLSCNKNSGWISNLSVNRIFIDLQPITVMMANI